MTTATVEHLRILLVDDDPDVRETLSDHLRGQGHAVETADGGRTAVAHLAEHVVDIVITDVRMPDIDGFALLATVRDRWPAVEVVVVTAFGDVDSAVRALREGAFDYFTKPYNVEDIAAALRRTARFAAMRRENERHRERWSRIGHEGRERFGMDAIVGDSDAIEEVKALITQVSRSETTTVLIEGETGTGKELVARAIHYESVRAAGPFVAVDCTALPETLVESELFGHTRGAFTDAREPRAGRFEQAHGGTLFFDEIGDMPSGLQMRLLRTLEERRVRPLGAEEEIPVDVRVVSATNRDARDAVDTGSFRQDLYYRLNAFSIRIPPLRERPADIRPTAPHFVDQFSRELHTPVAGFTDAAWAALESYDYPGNVRELRNLIERAVILCEGERIDADQLRFDRPVIRVDEAATVPADSSLDLPAAERSLVERALRQAGGNKAEAARLLGISRDSLRRRLDRFGLS